MDPRSHVARAFICDVTYEKKRKIVDFGIEPCVTYGYHGSVLQCVAVCCSVLQCVAESRMSLVARAVICDVTQTSHVTCGCVGSNLSVLDRM